MIYINKIKINKVFQFRINWFNESEFVFIY